jgi:hypothetical protein
MIRLMWCIAAFAALLPAVALAADVPYTITLDGRALTPTNGATGALWHDGVVFIDAVVATKAFDGLLTQRGKNNILTVTIHRHTGTYTVGSMRAVFDGKRVRLPGVPFRLNGDLYIPLASVAHLAGAGLKIDTVGHAAALTSPVAPAVGPGGVVTPVPHGT